MRLSELVKMLAADLETNGDTEHVTLGVTAAGTDGNRYRLDAVVSESNDFSVIRDSNVVDGMACVIADYKGLDLVLLKPAN